CLVDYRIAIRHGFENDDCIIISPGKPYIYPGSKDEVKNDLIPRLRSLAMRAPLPEQIKGVFPGVSQRVLRDIVLRLSTYRYLPDLHSQYHQRQREIFDNEIWPEMSQSIHPHKSRDDALNEFRKAMDDTFSAMERENRGNSEVKPVGKKG